MIRRRFAFRRLWAWANASSSRAHSSNSSPSTGFWLSRTSAARLHWARNASISKTSLAVRPIGSLTWFGFCKSCTRKGWPGLAHRAIEQRADSRVGVCLTRKLNAFEVTNLLPIGDGVVEGLRLEARVVNIELDYSFAESRARQSGCVHQVRSFGKRRG